nr:DNA-directed RNA polymerase subunit beta [Virgibacillus ndiopensis]
MLENKLKRKPKTETESGKVTRRKQKQKEEKQLDAGAESDVVTREQQKKKQKEEKKLNKKPRRRVFPIWLRIIVVLILCAVALLVGLMVGYGVIGDGKPSDALEMDTWQHIIDIVKKNK